MFGYPFVPLKMLSGSETSLIRSYILHFWIVHIVLVNNYKVSFSLNNYSRVPCQHQHALVEYIFHDRYVAAVSSGVRPAPHTAQNVLLHTFCHCTVYSGVVQLRGAVLSEWRVGASSSLCWAVANMPRRKMSLSRVFSSQIWCWIVTMLCATSTLMYFSLLNPHLSDTVGLCNLHFWSRLVRSVTLVADVVMILSLRFIFHLRFALIVRNFTWITGVVGFSSSKRLIVCVESIQGVLVRTILLILQWWLNVDINIAYYCG